MKLLPVRPEQPQLFKPLVRPKLVVPKPQPQLVIPKEETPSPQPQPLSRSDVVPRPQPQLVIPKLVLPNPQPQLVSPNVVLPNPQPQLPSRSDVVPKPQPQAEVKNTPSQQAVVNRPEQLTEQDPVKPVAVVEVTPWLAVTLIGMPDVVHDAVSVRLTVKIIVPAGGEMDKGLVPITLQPVQLALNVTGATLTAVTPITPLLSAVNVKLALGLATNVAGLMAPTLAAALGGAFAAQNRPTAASRATGRSLNTRRLFIG
jgi:hypothetical protein